MLTFSQFLAEKYLEEKLIMYNQGKTIRPNRISCWWCRLRKRFCNQELYGKVRNFKVRDVDEWKKAFMKIGGYNEYASRNQRIETQETKRCCENSHAFVKKKGIKDKSLDLMLSRCKFKTFT